VSEDVRKEIEEIMSDMNFHPTWVLLKTMVDLYEKFNIIDGKILEVINKRFEKQEEKA